MFAQLVLPLRDHRSVHVEADFAEETATAFKKRVYDYSDIDVILLEGIYLLKRNSDDTTTSRSGSSAVLQRR
jgi:uridine kinase